MQYRECNNEQERCFHDSIIELQKINKKISVLNLRKAELITQIQNALHHDYDGQKTYEYDAWKITVKTPYVCSLNKKLYESGSINLPDEFNPIKKYVAYSIDKKLRDKFLLESPPEIRACLVALIDMKPGKKSVTIKERS